MMWIDIGVILLVAILAVNGWYRGLLRSFPGVIAIILATLIAQHYYFQFTTWLNMRLHLRLQAAVVLGYLTLWLLLEISLEILLVVVFRNWLKQQSNVLDHVGGMFYGVIKAMVLTLLPLMAASVFDNVSTSPRWLQKPIVLSTNDEGYVVQKLRRVSKLLIPVMGKWVISNEETTFQKK